MTDAWNELIRGDRWRSGRRLWVEEGAEYTWEQVGTLAAGIEAVIRDHAAVRVVRIRSGSKLGWFAGQLAAWRVGCAALADDGNFGPAEIARVRPDLTLAVSSGPTPAVQLVERSAERLPGTRLPGEVVAFNFTSGTTGSRRAVAVTRGNLLALFACRDLDLPVGGGLTSGSFATPGYDGWWFDTWRAVCSGGTVVCLPGVNEDVFAWQGLAEEYGIDRVLLPAALLATIIDTVPACIGGIPWVFSGGEQFQAPTCLTARSAGLRNRFVNLYGPTEATFATHMYVLPDNLMAATIPIGLPLDGCEQRLRELDGRAGLHELVIAGPFVCLGYVENGSLARQFRADDGLPSYRTGDLVRTDDEGNLVFAGRLDSQIKVNGIRIDAAALERQVARIPDVLDCRVVKDELRAIAFVRVCQESSLDPAIRSRVESVVKEFTSAIPVRLVDRFPMKHGGKVDTAALMDMYYANNGNGEK